MGDRCKQNPRRTGGGGKIQCRACQGWGHYANECANSIRKVKGSAYWVNLGDDDESSTDNDESEDVISLTAKASENASQVATTNSLTSYRSIPSSSNLVFGTVSSSTCEGLEEDDLL